MHRHRRDDASPRRGFLTVLVARLIPVVPFTVVNYLAGATALRLRLFLSATALGIVPATTAHVAGQRQRARRHPAAAVSPVAAASSRRV